jgi:hypothetical protein
MYSLLPALVSIYFLFAAYYLCKHTNQLKRSHKAFLLLCITTFFWQATWAILFQTTDPKLSELLTRFGYLLIIILPTSLYQLLAEISGNHKERPYINFSYVISALLIVILISIDLFIGGYHEYFWGNYPKAGSLHWIHVAQTIVVVLRGLFVASIKEKNAQEPQKSILKYCKISVFIYFLAASDYLCNYGIEFYPLGILFVATSLTIIGYAMVKKDLFDIRAVISRTASQLIVASMIALSFVIINGFHHQSISFIIIANTCMGITWAMFGERLTQMIQTAAKKKWITDWYDATEIFNQITKKLYKHIEKKKIIEELAEILEKSMSIKSKFVYIYDNKKHFLIDSDKTLFKHQLQNKIQFIIKKIQMYYMAEILVYVTKAWFL